MTRAEKKHIAELIGEGQGDTAIARAVNRSRTTIDRYRWTLQQERAHTAAEQQTVELQRKLVERFVKSIDNLNLRSWPLGLAMLPEGARLSVLAHVTSVTSQEVLQFDRWLKTAAERWMATKPAARKPAAAPPSVQPPSIDPETTGDDPTSAAS